MRDKNSNTAKKWFLTPLAKIFPSNKKSLQLGNKIQKKIVLTFLTLIKSEARNLSEKERKKNEFRISGVSRA